MPDTPPSAVSGTRRILFFAILTGSLLVTLVGMLIQGGHVIRQERADIINAASQQALAAAETTAVSLDGMFRVVNFSLRSASREYLGHLESGRPDTNRFVIGESLIGTYYIIDRAGGIVGMSRDGREEYLPDVSRKVIAGYHASTLAAYRIAAASEWGLPERTGIAVTRAVSDDDGVVGVAVALVSSRTISNVLTDYVSGGLYNVIMVDSEGIELWQRTGGAVVPPAYAKRSGSGTVLIGDTDVFGWYQLHTQPFKVFVADSIETELAEWRSSIVWIGLLFGGMAVGVVVVLLLLRASLNRQRTVEAERIMVESSLAQQSKMATMGEMLGFITHQWKQPLNALGISLQMLEELAKKPDPPLMERLVGRSLEQVRFMGETIDHFSSFLRGHGEDERFDVVDGLVWILRMFSPALAKAGMRIELRCGFHAPVSMIMGDEVAGLSVACGRQSDSEAPAVHTPVYVKGRKNEFAQAVMNLVTNSRDAYRSRMDNGAWQVNGLIELSVGREDDRIVIEVRDHAGGIPESALPHVFSSRFSTKGGGGEGIGLHITRRVIERMGGEITVKNVDDGAAFCMKLPIEERPPSH